MTVTVLSLPTKKNMTKSQELEKRSCPFYPLIPLACFHCRCFAGNIKHTAGNSCVKQPCCTDMEADSTAANDPHTSTTPNFVLTFASRQQNGCLFHHPKLAQGSVFGSLPSQPSPTAFLEKRDGTRPIRHG